ncbi:hypothetical protein D5086_021737 [Populus alba]|uniref:Uncharacterized protein n=1 Tax=Populus alba TaxID=43335 RepID=A0ACC4BDC5_POPAL
MEGVGSRMGRTSSRYGLSATATVFNGSVRKWKRKWVHVSPSPTLNYRNNNHSNGHNDQNNNGSRLLLCRWTPLFPAASTSTTTEDPPKRKFRYTPIAVLKERSKAEKKAEQEVEKQLVAWQTAKNDEQNDEDDFKSETQANRSDFSGLPGVKLMEFELLFAATCKRIHASIRWNVISVILVSSKNPLLLQDSNLSHLDLGLCLKGRNSDLDSVGQSKEDQVKRASSGGLWAIG